MDNFSIQLQDPFSYAIWPVIVLGLLVLYTVVAFLTLHFLGKPHKEKQVKKQDFEKTTESKSSDKNAVKKMYMDKLNALEKSFANGDMEIRQAYQMLSQIMREFAYEMTGEPVHKLTLSDMKELNMPVLEELIAGYYSPEFANHSEGDVLAAITKAKRVVEEWN